MSIAEKLTAVAENEQKVYEAGKQAQYDAFWDDFQQNGTLTNYNRAFCGGGWNDSTFRPKYDIKPMGLSTAYSLMPFSNITDLAAVLEKAGVTIDLSGATDLGNEMFANCFKLTRVPVLDLSNMTTVNHCFAYDSALKTVEKMIVSEKLVSYANAFGGCIALEEIRFAGTIAASISFGYSSKLSRASIESIINALSDTTSGMSITLSETAVSIAFWNEDMGSIGLDWTELIDEKQNWTISLV